MQEVEAGKKHFWQQTLPSACNKGSISEQPPNKEMNERKEKKEQKHTKINIQNDT